MNVEKETVMSATCGMGLLHLFLSHLSFFFLFVKQISKKDQQIKTLQGELQAHKTEEEGMLLPQDQQSHPNIKASQVKQAGVRREIDQLKVQLNALMLENKRAETSLQQVSSPHPTRFTFQWL